MWLCCQCFYAGVLLYKVPFEMGWHTPRGSSRPRSPWIWNAEEPPWPLAVSTSLHDIHHPQKTRGNEQVIWLLAASQRTTMWLHLFILQGQPSCQGTRVPEVNMSCPPPHSGAHVLKGEAGRLNRSLNLHELRAMPVWTRYPEEHQFTVWGRQWQRQDYEEHHRVGTWQMGIPEEEFLERVR